MRTKFIANTPILLKSSGIILLIACLILSGFSVTFAESATPELQWSKTYGSYFGMAIAETSDGGFVVAGSTAEYSTQQRGYYTFGLVFLKISASGDFEWKKPLADLGYVSSIMETNSGFTIVGANAVLETDKEGNTMRNCTLYSTLGAWGVQTRESDYVFAGFSIDATKNLDYAVILKFDESGTLIWKQEHHSNGNMNVFGRAIMQANDGNYVVGGDWGQNFWLMKLSQEGSLLWNHTYSYDDFAHVSAPAIVSIIQAHDGSYVFSGFDGGYGWLVKTDPEGKELWHQRCDVGSHGFGAVAETADGGYIGLANKAAVKLDSLGNVQWSKFYSDNDTDTTSGQGSYAWNGIVTSDGGFAVTGFTKNSSQNDIWVARFAQKPTSSYVATVTPNQTTTNASDSKACVIPLIITSIVIVVVLGTAAISVYLKKRKQVP